MRVCRVGAGGELCQMLFGNLEGWLEKVNFSRTKCSKSQSFAMHDLYMYRYWCVMIE